MKLGGMIGKGVFYRSDSWRYEHYEERSRYAMNEDGQNALELYIEHEVQDESERNKIMSSLIRYGYSTTEIKNAAKIIERYVPED